MSSKWKIKYFNRFMGRGNPWIKISYASPAKKIILKRLEYYASIGEDIKDYLDACNRQGFFWLRYSKVIGTEKNPTTLFEIRYKGSKVRHEKNNIIGIPSKIADRFELLGNTPFRLKLEEKNVLNIKTINSKTTNSNDKNNTELIEQETKLVKPSIAFSLPGKEDNNNFSIFLLKEKAILK